VVDGVGPGPKLSRLAADPKFDLDRLPDRAYMKLLRVIANDFDIWWLDGDSTKLYFEIKETRDDLGVRFSFEGQSLGAGRSHLSPEFLLKGAGASPKYRAWVREAHFDVAGRAFA
jgi:hypothetical protein